MKNCRVKQGPSIITRTKQVAGTERAKLASSEMHDFGDGSMSKQLTCAIPD